MTQTDLFETHLRDNNIESTETLCINQKSFSGQNEKLFNLLMSGITLTFEDAFVTHKISDIRRRSKDLVDVHGFMISKKFLEGTRNKIWFCSDEDKEFNKQLLLKKQQRNTETSLEIKI